MPPDATTTRAPVARREERRPDLDSLYCVNPDGSRNPIHPADLHGRYQTRKRIIWTLLIAVYALLPWLQVDGRPAVLIDISHRRFFLFGATFNAQDFYLAFFLVTGIGFALIVVSALAGRLWCGYACPQSVFLEGLFRRIERWCEGSAKKRQQLDAAAWSIEKAIRRGGKYASFAVLSLALAHSLLGYFMPVWDLVAAVTSPPGEHPIAFAFVAIATAVILFNYAWFREQLCIVICPYGRLQGVLYDRDTINVGYDRRRGEPRGKYHAGDRGHCIDCFRCVAVCPTGIDIRNGTQLECIGCANCIDACDEVMDKLGQPRGLIRYDSQRGFEEGRRLFWRPRVLLYGVLLAVGMAVFTVAAWRREPFEAKLLRLQPYTLEGDVVTNAFTLHVVNKSAGPMTFELTPQEVTGFDWVLPIPRIDLGGLRDQRVPVVVRTTREAARAAARLRLTLRVDGEEHPIEVRVLGPDGG
jgi:cytochrome c oxidase accessory protein FixG